MAHRRFKRPNRPVDKHGPLTRHHVVPRSREQNDETVMLNSRFHNLWHQLFAEMTVDEVKWFIDEVMVSGRKWTHADLHALRTDIMAQTDREVRQGHRTYW